MKRILSILAGTLLFFGADALQAQSSCTSTKAECAKKCETKAAKECKSSCEKKCDGEKKAASSEIEFASITHAQLETLLSAGGVMLYDARGAESYEKGHIDGAILFANAALPTDKNAPMIFYCGGPRCSAAPKAARQMISDGYTNVMVFTGGWHEWSTAASDQAGL